jgi:hypothetical protein
LRSRLEVAIVVGFVVGNGSALRVEVAALDAFSESQSQRTGIRGWVRVHGAVDGVGEFCGVDVDGVVALRARFRLAGVERRVTFGGRGRGDCG